jgi:site-specific recombinase XerD
MFPKSAHPTPFARAVDSLGLNDGLEDARHKVRFHTLRHTFASWLIERGVSLAAVQRLLRHSSVTMTERYVHLSEDAVREGLEAVRDMIPGGRGAAGKG